MRKIIKSVIFEGEKVVKVSIFDFRGTLDRLKKWHTRAVWKPSIEEEREVEIREKKIKKLFNTTQAEKLSFKK